MAILSEEEFVEKLTPASRLLGLDVGSKTIGIAVGSMMGGFASPVLVIKRRKIADDSAILKGVMAEYGVDALVVGWPLNTDGTAGKRCQGVRDVLIEILKFLPDVPVLFFDERFSTAQSHTVMIDSVDMSRKRRGEIVDKMAAQVILSRFFGDVLRIPQSGRE